MGNMSQITRMDAAPLEQLDALASAIELATSADELKKLARAHADFLGLEFEYRFTGDEALSLSLKPALEEEQACQS